MRYRTPADVSVFERVVSIEQLTEGMTLIDKWGCKRNILSITNKDIWLSHKYGKQSRSVGKSWPHEIFLKNFPNWIFISRDERAKKWKETQKF